jgi:hypothetical protein
MTLHCIVDDLENHDWYERLVRTTLADVEAFTGRWAAFEELVFGHRDGVADPDETR